MLLTAITFNQKCLHSHSGCRRKSSGHYYPNASGRLLSCLELQFCLPSARVFYRKLVATFTARKEGKQIGRLKGQTPKRYKLSGKAAFIRRNRLAGRKRTAVIMFEITIVLAVRPSFLAKTRCLISSELSVTWATFNSFMRRNGIN